VVFAHIIPAVDPDTCGQVAKTTEELHRYALYVVIKPPPEGMAGEDAFQLGVRVRPNAVVGDVVKHFRQADGSPPAFALKHINITPSSGATALTSSKGRIRSLGETGGGAGRGWSSTPNLAFDTLAPLR
jgi:hypothetical protein